MLAMKSAGPKMIVSTRGEAAAIASMLIRPARSRSAPRCRSGRPGSPIVFSIWVSVRSSQSTWSAVLNLGQHDAVEVRPGALDDLDHIAVRPRAWSGR